MFIINYVFLCVGKSRRIRAESEGDHQGHQAVGYSEEKPDHLHHNVESPADVGGRRPEA